MKIDDDLLKGIYRDYLNTRIPSTRRNCPAFDDLIHLVDQEKTVRSKDDLLEHIFSCRPCADEFNFLREIRSQESILVDGIRRIKETPSISSRSMKRILSYTGIWKYAAMLIGLLVIFSITRYQNEPASTASFRSGPGHRINNILVVLLEPQKSEVTPFTWTLRWADSTNSLSYKLEIYDEALFPVHTVTDLKECNYTLPESFASTYVQNGSWFWSITTRLPSGEEIATSLHRFELLD